MKKGLLIFVAILSLFIGMNRVEAALGWNGGSGGAPSGSGGTCSDSWDKCSWNNMNFNAVKMTLIYYNGSSRETLARPFYIVNNRYQFVIDTLESNNAEYDVNRMITGGCEGSYCTLNSGSMKNYVLNETNLNYILSRMGTNIMALNRDSDEGIGYSKKGYRILIEPLVTFLRSGNLALHTIKELYSNGRPTSDNTRDPGWGWLLHTDEDDIGIYSAAHRGLNGNPLVFRDPSSGYGYNIVNIPYAKKCYQMAAMGTAPVCRNINKQNEGNFQETFKRVGCDSNEKIENATEDGRLTKTVNANCKIYCKESVVTKFPGNIMPAVAQGSYFVWPSFGKTKNEVHQLDITGTRSCVMKGNACGGYRATVNDLYKNFETSAKVKYNDPDYKRDITLEVDQSRNTSSVSQNGNHITVTRNVSLKIPDKIYRYVDKQTGKSVDSKNGSNDRYTDIGFGNLPISFKVPTGSKQNIQIFDIKLGVGNVFGSVANSVPYTCTYEASNKPTPCVCPPGTKNPGDDLWCKIAGSGEENLSCATAQSKYCDVPNGSEAPGGDDACPSKYCPVPNQHISVESCVLAGNTYNSCVNKYCSGIPEYRCPDDTPNKGMLLTGCVEELEKKGYSTGAAYEACKTINCPIKGINMIYRTIDLNNPFPSKNPNQGGAIAGFNLSVNGRYPGANWNSREIVKTKILQNRGTEGNNVYDKQPMYSITLNAANMRAVRKYNREKLNPAGYSDFTLDCLGDDGSKCRSNSFLRGNIKLLTGQGTCDSATGASQFDSCAN